MRDPLFSVAILTRNRAQQVLCAIESVIAQGRDDVEIVVVDNASDDDTAELVLERYPSVVFLRLPRNVGCPDGRNHAYANCRGRYIVNLDDDGWLGEGALDGLEEIFAADERIGIVAMRWNFADEGEVRGYSMSGCVEDVDRFAGGVSAFSRQMLAKTGGYPRDYFLHGEEVYLSLRALDCGFRIVSAPNSIVWHPRSGGSTGNPERLYHAYRDYLLNVTRLYPGRLLCKHLPLNLWNFLREAISRRDLRSYFRAVLNVIWTLPRTLATRQTVSSATVRRFLSPQTKMVRYLSRPLRVQIIESASSVKHAQLLTELSAEPRIELRVQQSFELWEALGPGDVLVLNASSPVRSNRRLLRRARRKYLRVIWGDVLANSRLTRAWIRRRSNCSRDLVLVDNEREREALIARGFREDRIVTVKDGAIGLADALMDAAGVSVELEKKSAVDYFAEAVSA